DKPPYRGGRVEVFTKPGAGSFNGSGFFNFNDSALNARDVFTSERAQISTRRYGIQLGGPIAPKKAGILFDFEVRDINESATVNAIVLGEDFRERAFAASVPAPKLLLIGSTRMDWQLTPNQTLNFRYDFNHDRLINQGVGGFELPSRAVNGTITSHSLRLAELAAINKTVFNEARLGISFSNISQRAVFGDPAVKVLGAFSGGGANVQSLKTNEQRLEFNDNLFVAAGNHSLKFGVQILGRKTSDARKENFNGTFIFGGASERVLVDEVDAAAVANISSLEQYRRALLNLPGGRATRFSINRGEPSVCTSQWTLGLFAQDEWRIGENLLLSLGLRYEAQSNPSRNAGLAPRVGIGYSPDNKRRWVLRARAGIFFDRIGLALPLENLRFGEGGQEQIIIDSPSFPDPFAGGSSVNSIPTVRRPNPDLRQPTSFQTQIGFERQLPQGWKLDVSHYWSRGSNLLRSRNINAPIFTEKDNFQTARRPLGFNQNILQFESSGKLAGQVLFVGLNQSSNKHFSVFSGYLWMDFHTDADHPFLLPQSSYDFSGEWARPVWQTRHRFFLVGLINFPWKLRASVELNLASGAPYNITTGRDNNNDGNFNDRPGRTPLNDPDAVATEFGLLNLNAINGTLERNLGTNPGSATLDFNLSRTFGFGGKGREPGSYRLTVNLRANNLLNRANLFGIEGLLSSPFFGRSNQSQPARRIEIGARFSF
ncbi:MAG TPA: TonB-dependent receptor, partial [Pyrinomonadaceae bacterium]|nr:TonB-dependent receptor [Pyrinomonadaceae bacterium]